MEDFYELLGVSENAGTDEIDRAWRERVRQYHPDVNDDTRANAQFKTLQTAHEVLTDDAERAAYDRLGHETYVQERLDGLPTADRSGDEGAEPGPTGSGGDGSGADAADRTDRTAGSQGDEDGRGATGRRRGGNAQGRAAGGGGGPDGGTGARTTTSSTTGRRRRPRRPLAYGWAGIATAGVVYLLGVWAYLGANSAAVSRLATASPTTLPSLLVRARTLVAPGTFVAEAAAAGAILPLALAAGAVGLAVGFVAVVASFGRGAAYLYAVGGLAPVAGLAAGPLVAAPDGVILALAVVVPVVTVLLFLIDVGRALLAGP